MDILNREAVGPTVFVINIKNRVSQTKNINNYNYLSSDVDFNSKSDKSSCIGNV